MGDHDDLPLPSRSPDTQVRRQGDRETHLGARHNAREQSPLGVGDTFGEFTLEKFLGNGSSGFVFRALDAVTNSPLCAEVDLSRAGRRIWCGRNSVFGG